MLLTPSIEKHFELMSIITVIDASNNIGYKSIFSSAAHVRKLMEDQIVCGSLLVLNKTDLVPKSQIAKIKQKIRKLVSEEKDLVECTFGQNNEDILFKKDFEFVSLTDQAYPRYNHSTVQSTHSTKKSI